ncbi:MAG: OsmC family protein [Candidatus Eisenbacteria bacterium]|uniref:OsmC family protein n=1 Tax=Eiseniibacteriota bacterium TaxID=2212470 RepID=A0A9D6L7S6_UNCEI|nr:OsmC family protein [Candidatus Eisenbacteria bacterium]MBI3539175.1 OsmC family protein [Candidatus Eisenbacteria bacterium]
MLGTLIGALDVRQVKLGEGALVAEAEGHHAIREGLPVLTEVRVRYRLRIPAGTRETVERALSRHQEKCPTAATLAGAVAVSWTAEIEEESA